MILCVCRNITEEQYKKDYGAYTPRVGFRMYCQRLKEDKTRCGACVCHIKESLDKCDKNCYTDKK